MIEREIEVPIEHIVEKPVYIDNIIEKRHEVLKEIPVYTERITETPINVITEIPVPVSEIIGKYNEKTLTQYIPKFVQKEFPVEYEYDKYNL